VLRRQGDQEEPGLVGLPLTAELVGEESEPVQGRQVAKCGRD